jgi:DNA-binding MarR family transcriptional regulator
MDTMSTPSSEDHRRLVERVVFELRALSTAQDRLDQYAAHRFGLNRTDLRALDLIGQAQTISPTALATALGMSTSATSTVLDRLERADYALRASDPHHRRRTLVCLTAHARYLSTDIFEPVIRGTTEQCATQTAAKLGGIAEFLAGHRAVLDQYLAAAGATDKAGPDNAAPVTTSQAAAREHGDQAKQPR